MTPSGKSPFRRNRKPDSPSVFDVAENVGSFGLIDGDFDNTEDYEKNIVQKLRDRGAL